MPTVALADVERGAGVGLAQALVGSMFRV